MFVSYIQVGGDAMQPEFVKEIIDIIISVIIYLAAFSLLVRELLSRKKKHESGDANEEMGNGAPILEQMDSSNDEEDEA